jgi:hypothetical protein
MPASAWFGGFGSGSLSTLTRQLLAPAESCESHGPNIQQGIETNALIGAHCMAEAHAVCAFLGDVPVVFTSTRIPTSNRSAREPATRLGSGEHGAQSAWLFSEVNLVGWDGL